MIGTQKTGVAKEDLTGRKIGRWSVLGRSKSIDKRVYWDCRCDCGTERAVRFDKVTESCGCLSRELAKKRFTTHGMSGSPEYLAWENMIVRCENPRHKHFRHYGGRGIKVCSRWRNSFEEFFEDMGKRPSSKHSIDRINNDGNYEPGNCRWATRIVQARNTRDFITVLFNGKNQSLQEWANETGIPRNRLYDRLYREGWSMERALTTPMKAQKRPQVQIITYNGRTQSLAKWAKELGIDRDTLKSRFVRGWTLAEALTGKKFGKGWRNRQ